MSAICDLYFSANFFYLFGSLAYIAMDVAASSIFDLTSSGWYNILSVILALVFVLDSVLYLLAWQYDVSIDKRRWDSSVWGEILNVFGSLLYLISSCLLFPASNEDTFIITATLLNVVMSAINLVAVVIFAVDAFIYFAAWWNAIIDNKKNIDNNNDNNDNNQNNDNDNVLKDWYFWASLWNVIPSIGYVVAAIYFISAIITTFPSNSFVLPSQMVPSRTPISTPTPTTLLKRGLINPNRTISLPQFIFPNRPITNVVNTTVQQIVNGINDVFKNSSAITASMDILYAIDSILYIVADLRAKGCCSKQIPDHN